MPVVEIPIKAELTSICREISDQSLDISQWLELESGDIFQLGIKSNIVGSPAKQPRELRCFMQGLMLPSSTTFLDVKEIKNYEQI